jgi:3-oxoadipate enol-lactonase
MSDVHLSQHLPRLFIAMKIEANGTSFHCQVDGDRGPWVLLSHGLATDLSMWDELASALKDRYRVIRYDARGHGDSAAPAGDYTLDMLVDDAAGILDALGADRVHFAGLSMGGMVGLGLLINYPARIKSAVIADSRHTTTPEFTAAWIARAVTVRKSGIESIVASTVARWSSAGLAERNPAAVARMQAMIRRTSVNGYCGCAHALAHLNYGPRLGEITAPTLVMCGSEDHGAPPENTRQMHAMIRNSQFLEIGQAGHIANIEQPKLFNGAVQKFLNEVEPV